MNNRVVCTMQKYDMISYGDRVVVALSGGADSVTLLSVLNSIKEQFGLTLYAAHINHCLRGEESDRDESFCKILCKNYNIELFTKKLDVKSLAKQKKISEELCGRNVRYEFLDELSHKLNAKVATAHTASDNAETVLFNLSRGSGINGVGGIAPVRGNVIRPLIELERNDIEQYCLQNSLDYVIDSTNLCDDYTRNKIRHFVVPELKKINPRLENSILHFSQDARELEKFVTAQAQSALDSSKCEFGYDCQKMLSFDSVVLKKAIVILCKNVGLEPERKHIQQIFYLLNKEGAVELSKKYSVIISQGILRIKNAEKQNLGEISFHEQKNFFYNGKEYVIVNYNSNIENKRIIFRNRKSGDTFAVPKRNVTKPLRKLMNELKIPSELRDRLVVLAEGNTILWCEKVGLSADGMLYNLNINVSEGGNSNA